MTILSTLIGWKGYAVSALGGALLAGAIAGGAAYWVTAQPYKLEVAGLQNQITTQRADAATASLTKLTTYIANMQSAAASYQSDESVLVTRFDQLSGDLKNVQKQNPLPVDCKPDVSRVRSFDAAIDAANGAAAAR